MPQHEPHEGDTVSAVTIRQFWAKKANGVAVGRGAHGHESFCIVAFVALHALCLREVIKLADNRTCDPKRGITHAERTACGTHHEGHNRLAEWSMQRAACNKILSENVPSSVRLRFARSAFGSYFSACSPSSESDGPKGRRAANGHRESFARVHQRARALSYLCGCA